VRASVVCGVEASDEWDYRFFLRSGPLRQGKKKVTDGEAAANADPRVQAPP